MRTCFSRCSSDDEIFVENKIEFRPNRSPDWVSCSFACEWTTVYGVRHRFVWKNKLFRGLTIKFQDEMPRKAFLYSEKNPEKNFGFFQRKWRTSVQKIYERDESRLERHQIDRPHGPQLYTILSNHQRFEPDGLRYRTYETNPFKTTFSQRFDDFLSAASPGVSFLNIKTF